MKKTIPFCLLLLINTLNAQEIIVLEQDAVSQVNENVDISDYYKDFPLDLYFKNNTDDSIFVNWRREFGDNCPLAWDVVVADQFLTYIPTVNASFQPIAMAPADSHFIIRQIFYPRMIAGCCDIQIIFSLDGNASNPIDTGYYSLEINSEGCLTTSVDNVEREAFRIYPNPSVDVLNIDCKVALESIEIFDWHGKLYRSYLDLTSNQINISTLPTGIYLCKIKSRSGKNWIKKIIKQ